MGEHSYLPVDRVSALEGEVFRYYVKSWSGPAVYLVDLAEDDCRGTCSCTHFGCRVAPARKDGKTADCKHIRAAIAFAWPKFARAFIKEMESRGRRR